MSPEFLDDPANAKQKELLLWYYDRWLPICAGNLYWGETIRYYKLPSDTCKMPNGEEKGLVTVTNEAFGLLVLENCHQKWMNIFQYKAKHGRGAKIPNIGPESLPFKAKWTKDRQGQVRFGGWSDAYPRFEELKNLVLGVRCTDKSKDYEGQKYAKELMRTNHKIKDDVYTKRSSRKRKTAAPPARVERKLRKLDE